MSELTQLLSYSVFLHHNCEMSSPVLSFQASCSAASRAEIDKLINSNWPFQVMPGGRSVLSSKQIDEFPTGENPNVLIHSTYIVRPFGDPEKLHVAKLCLTNYARLAKKIGSTAVLVHMPASPNELTRFGQGIELIDECLTPYGCVLHLETEPLTKSMRDKLEMNEENAYEIYCNYTDRLFEVARDARLVVDTAHLFANGLSADDQISFIERYKEQIDFIHLNGNSNNRFHSDKHTPMFSANNKIANSDKLVRAIVALGKTCIAENSTEGSTRAKWIDYADKLGFILPPNFKCFNY